MTHAKYIYDGSVCNMNQTRLLCEHLLRCLKYKTTSNEEGFFARRRFGSRLLRANKVLSTFFVHKKVSETRKPSSRARVRHFRYAQNILPLSIIGFKNSQRQKTVIISVVRRISACPWFSGCKSIHICELLVLVPQILKRSWYLYSGKILRRNLLYGVLTKLEYNCSTCTCT